MNNRHSAILALTFAIACSLAGASSAAAKSPAPGLSFLESLTTPAADQNTLTAAQVRQRQRAVISHLIGSLNDMDEFRQWRVIPPDDVRPAFERLVRQAGQNVELLGGARPFGHDFCIAAGPVGDRTGYVVVATGGRKLGEDRLRAIAAAATEAGQRPALGLADDDAGGMLTAADESWAVSEGQIDHACPFLPGRYGVFGTLPITTVKPEAEAE